MPKMLLPRFGLLVSVGTETSSKPGSMSLLQKGYEISGNKMDDELQEALECLQNVVGSEDLWVEAPLERGQIQFLDNQNLIH